MNVPTFTKLRKWPATASKRAVDSDAPVIRALALAGYTHKQICLDYQHKSATTIWRIMHGIDQRKPKVR